MPEAIPEYISVRREVFIWDVGSTAVGSFYVLSQTYHVLEAPHVSEVQ